MEAKVNMPSDLIEFITVVGTFAFYVITAIVLLMLLVSLLDRHKRPKSEHITNEDGKSQKP